MSAQNNSGERYLALPGGRTLAYAGNIPSKTLALHLHGSFTIGNASQTSPVILSKNNKYPFHLAYPAWMGQHISTTPIDIIQRLPDQRHDCTAVPLPSRFQWL